MTTPRTTLHPHLAALAHLRTTLHPLAPLASHPPPLHPQITPATHRRRNGAPTDTRLVPLFGVCGLAGAGPRTSDLGIRAVV